MGAFLVNASLAGAIAKGRLELRIEPPPGGIVLGHAFTLRLEYHGPADVIPLFPEIPDLGPDYRAFKKWGQGHDPEDGRSQSYRVLPFRSGRMEVPGIAVKTAQGKTLSSNRAEILVRSPLSPEDGQLREPDLLQPLPEPASRTWIAWLSAVLVLVAGGAAWIRHGRTSRREGGALPVPPHITALQALQALEGARIDSRARFDAFHVSLSAAVKRYLQARFQVEVLDKTTDALDRLLARHTPLDPEQVGAVVRLLDHSDLAKFSPCEPDPNQADRDLAEATRFIHDTAPDAAGEAQP